MPGVTGAPGLTGVTGALGLTNVTGLTGAPGYRCYQYSVTGAQLSVQSAPVG